VTFRNGLKSFEKGMASGDHAPLAHVPGVCVADRSHWSFGADCAGWKQDISIPRFLSYSAVRQELLVTFRNGLKSFEKGMANPA
jgi:hypothetical protein